MIFGPSSVSSGVSSGTGKNYLSTYNNNPGNGDFETGSTANWSLGTIGTLTNGLPTGSPTFGSGASGNLSIATVTGGSQLAGTYSLSYASSAATTAGDMLASASFTIDIEDRAKVLGVKFYYSPTVSPSNGNWSGTSSNSFAWAAWDVTNSVWLPSTANFNLVGSSFPPPCMGTVQTGATTSQIRFCVYNANATSGAITVLFDDFSVGPQTSAQAPAMSDFTAFTPTGSWASNTTYTGWWKREGDKLSMIVKLALAGAPTSASLTVNLPSGLVIDTTKLPATPANTGFPSSLFGQGAAHSFIGSVYYSSTTAVALNFTGDGSTASIQSTGAITQAAPYTFANADLIYATVTNIPIVGWSSNTVSSADTDTRVIAFGALQQTPTGTLTTSFNVIKFGTVAFDDVAGYSTSTGLYTAAVSGKYQISGVIEITGTYTAAQKAVIAILKNGAINVSSGAFLAVNSITTAQSIQFSGEVVCSAGDTLGVYALSNGASLSYTAVNTASALFINRLSGPAVVQATESVSAKYTQASAVGFTNTSADIVVPFTTKVWDTHNFFGGTQAVFPVSGKFRVSSIINLQSATLAVGNQFYMSVYQNGSGTAYGAINNIYATGAGTFGAIITTDLSVNAGDTAEIRFAHNRSGGGATLSTAGPNNHVCIERIGN